MEYTPSAIRFSFKKGTRMYGKLSAKQVDFFLEEGIYYSVNSKKSKGVYVQVGIV